MGTPGHLSSPWQSGTRRSHSRTSKSCGTPTLHQAASPTEPRRLRLPVACALTLARPGLPVACALTLARLRTSCIALLRRAEDSRAAPARSCPPAGLEASEDMGWARQARLGSGEEGVAAGGQVDAGHLIGVAMEVALVLVAVQRQVAHRVLGLAGHLGAPAPPWCLCAPAGAALAQQPGALASAAAELRNRLHGLRCSRVWQAGGPGLCQMHDWHDPASLLLGETPDVLE